MISLVVMVIAYVNAAPARVNVKSIIASVKLRVFRLKRNVLIGVYLLVKKLGQLRRIVVELDSTGEDPVRGAAPSRRIGYSTVLYVRLIRGQKKKAISQFDF